MSGRGGLIDESLAAKRNKLFGGGLTDSRDNSENERPTVNAGPKARASTAPKY